MSKYLRNYENLNTAKADETIVSPNVTLIADNKTLHLDTHVDDEELLVIGSSLEKSRIVKKYIADTTSNPELITLARSLGWIDSDAVKMSVLDAMAVTRVNDNIGYSLLSSSGLKSFDEFEWFTGVTACPGYKSSGSVPSLPNSCTSIKLPESITSIKNSAFRGCSGLSSVTIPNSVTDIGVGDGNGDFASCSSLTSIEIPNSVTRIGAYTFRSCTSLTSVTIGNGVTIIGRGAFSGCSGLTSATIPDGVTIIEVEIFGNCSSLTSVTIPNSVTSIGDMAFSGCSGLTSVTIPDGVTSIGSSIFGGCSGLTLVTIPDSVNSIGQSAFQGCSGLTSIDIPDSVTSIGFDTFYNCSGLTFVNITDITAWCNITFGGSGSNPLFYAKHLYINNVEVTDLTIPNSATSIGNYAFWGCSGLSSVQIGNNVTNIGMRAFYFCTGLTSVTIGNSVTSIGEMAFNSCTSLTSITFTGTSTQWRAIVRGSSWHQSVPATTVYCEGDGVTVSLDATS